MGHVEDIKPGLLVVDSVQTMSSPEADSAAGGVTQIKAVTAALVALAKERALPVILVGHVTKEGAIAGPRVLEHLVDVVLHFEGDRHSSLRMLRGVKNRYGPADEVGCFEMVDRGIVDVPDPSGLFLNRHDVGVPGTCVTVAMDGKRPMLVEVQALVANTPLNTPRRAVSGLDSARVAMILAVLERRGGMRLSDKDVFAATVGGMKVGDRLADLSVALAIATAAKDVALPPDLVVLGEVGLAGEVRRVGGVRARLAEALRLGFTKALIPPDCGDVPDGLQVRVVRDLGSAMNNLQVLRG
jgi:DNA repair protein RadA/Sms